MIHTANLYLTLDPTDIDFIQNKYNVALNLLSDTLSTTSIRVHFFRHYGIQYMNFNVDFIKLLDTSCIAEDDFEKVCLKISNYLEGIFKNDCKFEKLVLTRIDYRLDAIVPKEHRDILLNLYKKTIDKHGHKEKNDSFNTSLYFKSKSMQLCIYDKETECKSKGRNIKYYEKNVLRLEVRLLNRHLNYMKNSNGLTKCLQNYFSDSFFINYVSKSINQILFTGDYYKIDKARSIINNSSLKEKDKVFLIEFLICVSKNNITHAKKSYSGYHVRKALNNLSNLGINPILIPKNYKNSPSFIQNPFKLNHF